MRLLTYISIVLLLCAGGCRHKATQGTHALSGNAVQDYFYRMGYTYPIHCESRKPICKAEDTLGGLGPFHRERVRLAEQALAIAKPRLALDSLTADKNIGVAVFPISAVATDNPYTLYRVLVKTYRNNPSRSRDGLALWQVIDSNKIIVEFHTLDFLIDPDGVLEYVGASD